MTNEQHRDIGEQIEQLRELTRAINTRADELSRHQDRMTHSSDALKQNAVLDPGTTWPSPHEYHEAVRDLGRLEAAREKALLMLATLGVDRDLFREAERRYLGKWLEKLVVTGILREAIPQRTPQHAAGSF